MVKKYVASLSFGTELAERRAGIASSAKAADPSLETHRSSAGHSSDEAGSQIPTARGRSQSAGIGAIRCSFLVEYASDQSPRRHCLATKRGFKTFLDNPPSPKNFSVTEESWLVEDGASVVGLKSDFLPFWLLLQR